MLRCPDQWERVAKECLVLAAQARLLQCAFEVPAGGSGDDDFHGELAAMTIYLEAMATTLLREKETFR